MEAEAPALVRLARWSAKTSYQALRFVISGAAVDALTSEARLQLRNALGVVDPPPREIPVEASSAAILKERGAELLASEEDDDAHPAYELILASIAPDEARLLRRLAVEGDAEDLATAAGVRNRRRLPAYLDNLQRLHLVTTDSRRRRETFRLTRFGQEFCEVCLPVDTAGFLALKDGLQLSR